MNTITSKIAGIPCLIEILSCEYIPADRLTWSSDIDYKGGYIPEWQVLDRKGYLARWLGKKLKASDIDRIDQEVIEDYKRRN